MTLNRLLFECSGGDHSMPDPGKVGIRYLDEDGDFRSAEGVELLKQADIVVTNPPFSLFRNDVSSSSNMTSSSHRRDSECGYL